MVQYQGEVLVEVIKVTMLELLKFGGLKGNNILI